MKTFEHRWLTPSVPPALQGNDVHVWRTVLDQPAARVQQFARALSDDERRRAERFHFARDRNHFIVCRGVLRAILGRYLEIEPSRVQFCYGPHEKPYLASRCSQGALEFNLSHSHGLGLYAFTRGQAIGVDLEFVHPIPDMEQIAARFFSAHENAVLQALPTDQKSEAFFNCWTRKEAYIKAIGVGLAQPLDQFDVSLAPGEPGPVVEH